jgi:uncharacterized membrane protein
MIAPPTIEIVAFVWFASIWIVYTALTDWTTYGAGGLNARVNHFRHVWMQEMLRRDMRNVDCQIMASLQNGTAFFASSSLIAIGGAVAILRASQDFLDTVATLPFGTPSTPLEWQAKAAGLIAIFTYAFFKFAWSYRLFNYAAIMIGAAPPRDEAETPRAQDHASRTALLSEEAATHFNRGQRALFFALAYIGWFVGAWLLIILTVIVFIIQWRRHFDSKSARSILK